MEWIYMAGVGINGFGYMQLLKLLGPMDKNSTFNGLKLASSIGGLVSVAIGFLIFEWWVPLIGIVAAPMVVGLISSRTPMVKAPQIAIALGLFLSFLGLVAG